MGATSDASLFLLGIHFRSLHGAIRVLGRTIERVEADRLLVRVVYHIVPRACWNDHRVSAARDVFSSVHHESGLAFLDPEELVGIVMNFFPDVLAFLKTHQDELFVLAREENLPKKGIVERRPLD